MHKKRVEIFRNEIRQLIKQKITTSGNNSIYACGKSIKIVETEFDTPGNGIAIIEVAEDVLVDYRGLHFDYECLSTDDLAKLADLINA